MEVYVRDEELESKNRSYKFVGNDKIKFSTNNMGIIQIEEYFAQIKSLEQHDAELKTKWCDDLMELANKKMVWTDDLTGTYTGIGYKIFQNVLKQKLEEMKGEK